jgi:hypothetical protein
MSADQTGHDQQHRLSSLYTTPDLLPQKLDLVTRRVLLLEIDPRRYHESA